MRQENSQKKGMKVLHSQRMKIRNEMYKAEDLEYAVGFVTIWGLGMVAVITILILI